MPTRIIEMARQQELRHEAEGRLAAGTARSTVGRAAGAEALKLLQALATSPATAGDALKFFHELQVHQVELDLQQEELERSRKELHETLDRYVESYDLAPVGLLTIDRSCKIIESNLRCAELLGVDPTTLGGRRIDSFMTEESRPALVAMLRRLTDGGGSREACRAQTDGASAGSRYLQLAARAHPDGQLCLVALIDPSEGIL